MYALVRNFVAKWGPATTETTFLLEEVAEGFKL